MTPDGKKPTEYKRYYDITTWFFTQLVFSFTTAPFILLSIRHSMMAWARVYFYGVIGVTLCSLFLVTPGKAFLRRKVKARTATPEDLHRQESQESLQGATLGVPHEPGQEFDEMVDEIVAEVKRRRGSKGGPEGQELRRMVEETLLVKANGGKDKEL